MRYNNTVGRRTSLSVCRSTSALSIRIEIAAYATNKSLYLSLFSSVHEKYSGYYLKLFHCWLFNFLSDIRLSTSHYITHRYTIRAVESIVKQTNKRTGTMT